jgi:hypothetical protein
MPRAKPQPTKTINVRLPTTVLAELNHLSVISGQPVDAVVAVLLAMRVIQERRAAGNKA